MDEKFHRLFDRIWYGFLDTAEMVLVKWGWIIFPLGLPGVWIPFFGHTVLNIIVMVLAIMLVYLFSRRFIQHAVAEYHKKSYGRMIMFLVLALPFSASSSLRKCSKGCTGTLLSVGASGSKQQHAL